jgi:hypothetical protein
MPVVRAYNRRIGICRGHLKNLIAPVPFHLPHVACACAVPPPARGLCRSTFHLPHVACAVPRCSTSRTWPVPVPFHLPHAKVDGLPGTRWPEFGGRGTTETENEKPLPAPGSRSADPARLGAGTFAPSRNRIHCVRARAAAQHPPVPCPFAVPSPTAYCTACSCNKVVAKNTKPLPSPGPAICLR